ncbi:MAG: acetylxylan esterase, partial [Planctomycetota bacterium]
GLLGPPRARDHRLVAHNALQAGSFYKAEVARDLRRALTLLQRWPGVDPERIAVAGASLGGEIAVALAALDPRVRATAVSSHGGAVGPAAASRRAPAGRAAEPHGCHLIPGINAILHREDWFRILAPRPLLVVRGRLNLPAGMESFTRAVRRAYRPLGAEDAFRSEAADGGHEFFVEPTIRFLRDQL